MRLTRQRIIVIGVATAALTALIASTALGGLSLKKQVKKEVAKQLAGKTGPAGPQGLQGLQGPQGTPGPAGVVGRSTLTASSAFDSNSPKTATVTCPGNKVAIGGGASIFSTNEPNDTIAMQSSRLAMDNEWEAVAYESTGDADSWGIDVTVICANP